MRVTVVHVEITRQGRCEACRCRSSQRKPLNTTQTKGGMCSVLDPSTGGHSKSSRTSTTWPVGWCWERRRWRALDGRYGDVKRERRCER